ncbi:MAG: general secretion pathway protein GspF [Candidatus Obscuribacterales bacterium]|nr:general secretion pathway protein GspF [Steroidobacteraceae bacterium]
MIIRRASKRPLGLDEPLRHESHRRPVTRRDFLAQGFITGAATVIAPSLLGILANPKMAHALSPDIDLLRSGLCNIQQGAGKVPFIAFDLAGGANIAGSNVLVGQQGGQLDFLTTAGYSKLGLAGNMVPNASVAGSFVDSSLGLAFHTDSAFLRGMMTKISPTTAANTNGIVIPARSENDTQNNPHNPMYGIARAGARGELLSLIGSQSSDSGGNSMAPAMMINAELRPTKVDRTSDATGLVDTGQLGTLLPSQADTVSVMESIQRVSAFKLGRVSTGLAGTGDADAKRLVQCSYVKTAYQAENFGSSDVLNPRLDPSITGGATPIFSAADLNDREFEKTASVMKLVVNGFAGAGTIAMGGYDYHTGDRSTGEMRDFRAGQCMGACLEYAARVGKPLMMYVFSDGSLSSNGMLDNSVGGRGKGQWTGDNQSTAASFYLVYNPTGRPTLAVPGRNQLGHYRSSGDVETAGSPAGNAVNLLVEMVILNYMALHGEEGNFQTLFPNTGLSTAQIGNLIGVSRIL